MTSLQRIKTQCQTHDIALEPKILLTFIQHLHLNPETVTILKGESPFEIKLNGIPYLILTDQQAEKMTYDKIQMSLRKQSYQPVDLDLMDYIPEEFLEMLCEDLLTHYLQTLEDDEEELLMYYRAYRVSSPSEIAKCLMEDTEAYDYLSLYYTDKELIDLAIEAGALLEAELIYDLLSLNGRGSQLATDDGLEIEFNIRDTLYYAYRQR